MKKIGIISICTVMLAMSACNKVRRSPGRAYMPDMSYSRAYETYASTEALKEKGINYTGMPVPGTIAVGDMLAIYPYANDSAGYVQSASVKNPLLLDTAYKMDLKEAERLYLVNCGICHGSKLDGNGPLYNDGKGPFLAAPKNLVADDMVKLADGTYFHSITYGKGAMGSYASQLNTEQRWMVIAYIRSKQAKPAAGATKPATDTTAAPKQP